MHQKKIAKLKKFLHKNLLHSIPIGNKFRKRYKLNNNNSNGNKKLLLHHNLAYVSYSIPLLSSFALLMVLGLSFAPDLITSIVKDVTKVDKASALNTVAEDAVPVDYATTYNSGSSLTITPAATGGHGASADAVTMVTPGTVAYRAHDVHVHLEDANSYSLQISYSSGRTNLSLVDGNTTYSDVPAAGVKGSSMAQGTWGFAWGDTNAVDADMTYYKMPQFNQSGTNIQNGELASGDANASGVADFTKKLVFGASFTPNAVAGHYTTSVLLSLAASAKDVTNLAELAELGTMQGMTPEICTNSPFDKQVYSVADFRERDNGKKYGVTKLSNGDCWMTQNLSLDLNGKTLTPSDSNVTANWTSTTGASAMWATTGSTNDAYNMVKYFNGTGGSNYNSAYGYYYSFGAATAGTSKNFTSSSSQQTTQDICPKGWRLPTRADFAALIGTSSYNGVWNATSKAFVMNTTMGNLSFPAAGLVFDSALSGAGSYGYYWSSTTYGSTSAYSFYFISSNTAPGDSSTRYGGRSVRCIAKRLGDA